MGRCSRLKRKKTALPSSGAEGKEKGVGKIVMCRRCAPKGTCAVI